MNHTPLCIYHRGDFEKYSLASEEEQLAWNEYVEEEADVFNSDPRLDSYDSTNTCIGYNRDGKITDWSPPLFFPEWLKKRKIS